MGSTPFPIPSPMREKRWGKGSTPHRANLPPSLMVRGQGLTYIPSLMGETRWGKGSTPPIGLTYPMPHLSSRGREGMG